MRLSVAALRNDLAVLLDRDTLVLQGKLADEVGDGQGVGAAMRGAVEDDREHGGGESERGDILARAAATGAAPGRVNGYCR